VVEGGEDVDVEREAEGDQLSDGHAVERRPRLELADLDLGVLRRKGVAVHPGVHAVGVRLEHPPGPR
jgi:hypothetical protein